MKGIILAGGSGSRLYPVTLAVCKQLLPIYDKPMIYYPLSVLMLAGIREILIISTPKDLPRFQQLLGDGSECGLSLTYQVQERPEGIAHAFILAEEFIGEDTVALILGDNIFYGQHLEKSLADCQHLEHGAIIFGYQVKDPERYGVVTFDKTLRVTSLEEKPKHPASSYAVTGLYFYDNNVVSIAKHLAPSPRGELEVTDISRVYLERGELSLRLLEKGFAWLDTGTPDALQQASSYVQTIQERQGIQIACIEEIAYEKGWITQADLEKLGERYSKNAYGSYLKKIASDKKEKKIGHVSYYP